MKARGEMCELIELSELSLSFSLDEHLLWGGRKHFLPCLQESASASVRTHSFKLLGGPGFVPRLDLRLWVAVSK